MSKYKDAEYQEFIQNHKSYGFIIDPSLLALVRADALNQDVYFEALQALGIWWNGEQPGNLTQAASALFNTMLEKAKQGLDPSIKLSKAGKKYRPSEQTDKSAQKVKPTLDDVKKLFTAEGLNGDPIEFFDYYEVRGWTYEKTGAPIKDLEQVARAWSEKHNDQGGEWFNDLTSIGRGIAKDKEDHTVLNDLKP